MLVAAVASVVPGHLGALHPVEQALTVVVAFAPFLILGGLAARRRLRPSDPARPPQQARADLEDLPWAEDLTPPS